MARSDPYGFQDLRSEDYYDTSPRNTGTGWVVALILIVAAIAATLFFGRSDTSGIATNPMTTPGTSSTMNPPLSRPATPPAAIPNPNPAPNQ
jgi:hypothetical protein